MFRRPRRTPLTTETTAMSEYHIAVSRRRHRPEVTREAMKVVDAAAEFRLPIRAASTLRHRALPRHQEIFPDAASEVKQRRDLPRAIG
jgi:hypothetical protein